MQGNGLFASLRGIGHGALQLTLEQIHAGALAAEHLHPAAGTADSGDHGRGADVQGFVVLQRRRHMKEQVAGVQQHFQLFALLSQFGFTYFVQLDGLGFVQAHPGIAGRIGDLMVAVIQAHPFGLHQFALAAVRDGHGPFRLFQTNGGRLLVPGLRRQGCLQHGRDHHHRAHREAEHSPLQFFQHKPC